LEFFLLTLGNVRVLVQLFILNVDNFSDLHMV